MQLPNNYAFEIDDIYLEKHLASEKIGDVVSFVQKEMSKPLVKTASNWDDSNDLVKLFTQMLATLNLQVGDSKIEGVIESLSKTATSKKNASGSERRDDIKIVSKEIKDSHYQIDISKDIITKHNNKLYMVSCYARDAYLGRYLIKRNYFFTADREKFANEAYDEILTKTSALKDRYYSEVINISSISTQIKMILDGVVSEIKMEEDSLATNINRLPPS